MLASHYVKSRLKITSPKNKTFNGSRTIAPERNCPPTLTLTQTLTLTGGNCPDTLSIYHIRWTQVFFFKKKALYRKSQRKYVYLYMAITIKYYKISKSPSNTEYSFKDHPLLKISVTNLRILDLVQSICRDYDHIRFVLIS